MARVRAQGFFAAAALLLPLRVRCAAVFPTLPSKR
jgi:hypothetical protein